MGRYHRNKQKNIDKRRARPRTVNSRRREWIEKVSKLNGEPAVLGALFMFHLTSRALRWLYTVKR